MTSQVARIALVGHCGPDCSMLRAALASAAPGCAIERVQDEAGAVAAHKAAALLLINRVLDGDFADSSGIGLIRRLAASGSGGGVLMLVSDLAVAQSEATLAGAAEGFGKSELYAPRMRARVQAALARSSTPPGAGHDQAVHR